MVLHLVEQELIRREPEIIQLYGSDDEGDAMSDRGGRVSPVMIDENRQAMRCRSIVTSKKNL